MRLPKVKNLAGGILIFCLLLLITNALLSFTGLEKYDRKFNFKSSHPIFVAGEGDLSQFYVTNPQYQNTINYQVFPINKREGVKRIFVIGCSAAFAWPFTEEFGFTGYLRRALDLHAPGKFEIINAAGMSFGTHRVYDVLQDIVDLHPDLIIIYTGNNEYVERNVVTKPKNRNIILERINILFNDTSIYRAIRLLIFRFAPDLIQQQTGPDLTDLRADTIVSRGALGRSTQIDQEVLTNFSKNIKEIRDLIISKNIKCIFCTMPSNVVTYSPTSPPLRFNDKGSADRWKLLQKEAVDSINLYDTANEKNKNNESLRHAEILLSEMAQLTPNDPWIYFSKGQVYIRMGDHDRAYNEFVHAKDLDARPIRALSSFNETIRAVVKEKQDRLDLLDLEKTIADEIRTGNSDWLYLDYCHFTEAGHKLIAIRMLHSIRDLIQENLNIDQLSYAIFTDDWGKNKNQLIQNNMLYARGSTYIHNENYTAAEADFLKILNTFAPDAKGTYVSSVYRALSYVYEGLGDKSRYKLYLLKSIDANPENYEALVSGGYFYIQEGNLEKAENFFYKSIELNNYTPLAFEGLGRIWLIRGSAQKAISHFEKSIQMGGDNFSIQKDLGKAYLALDQTDKAITAWKKALEFDPSDSELVDLINKYSDTIEE